MKPTKADLALMATTPVEMVPLLGQFEPIDRIGHRFLAAKDGLWLEARRAWGRVVWPLAHQDPAVRMPFGQLAPDVELAFELPKNLIGKFVQDARAAHPAEVGAVVIWNSRCRTVRYHLCETVEAGVGHLRQRWPELSADEAICMDLHSHGPIPAYFSAEDRKDTGSEMVVAVVVGKVDLEEPEVVVSLFACGVELSIFGPGSTLAEMNGWGQTCQR